MLTEDCRHKDKETIIFFDKLGFGWVLDEMMIKKMKLSHLSEESAINRSLIKGKGIASYLRNVTAEVVSMILMRHKVDELMIEGGATAYSIIQKCGYHEFDPVQELSHGVLRMRVIEDDEFYITLKPGSYKWPNVIWNF